eukprot:3887287-Lingulodinium_polyedra.AAC.1
MSKCAAPRQWIAMRLRAVERVSVCDMSFCERANASRDRCHCTVYRQTCAIRIPIVDLRSAV